MSRSKVHPEKYRTKIRKAKESEPTASLAQINNSFLHDNPNTGNSFTCMNCFKEGENLILVCQCPKEYYHPYCLNYHLKEKIKE